MDEAELGHEALYDAFMILAQGWALSAKPSRLARWRRNCERLLRQPAANPAARQEAAVWIRGLFAHGRTLRS